MISPSMFRAYDIRGIAHLPEGTAPVDLNPESLALLGLASASMFLSKGLKRIAVGYDCRISSPSLKEVFIENMRKGGCDIIEIGQVSSPMLYFSSCFYEDIDGGVCITASHNPKEYNGLKFVAKNAHSICGEDLQILRRNIENGSWLVEAENKGTLEEKSVLADYKNRIQNNLQVERPLRVVMDAGNGVAGPFMRTLFTHPNIELHTLFEEPDGLFPNHPANPEEEENMQDLAQKVRELKADIGIAFDGDGDRVGLVDEQGHHYNADLLLLYLAEGCLARNPGAKIVYDVKVSQVLIDGIQKAGGVGIMSKTGHSFIESKMHEVGALLGGEISGHIFFAENDYGFDDAFVGAAKILSTMSQSPTPISAFFKSLPQLINTPEIKCPCPDDQKFKVVADIQAYFVQKYPCETMDGARISFKNNAWAAIRCSNTSPNLTLRFEAENMEDIALMQEEMRTQLQAYPFISVPF